MQIFKFVSMCIAVNKSGNPWWAMLIPFYNNYVLCKVAKKPKLFWLILPLSIIGGLVTAVFYYVYLMSIVSMTYMYDFGIDQEALDQLLTSNTAALLIIGAIALVSFAISIAQIVVTMILDIGIAKAFGRSAGFGVGLFFIPVVFWAILAFDTACVYQRDSEEERDDGVYYVGG